jgi:hypothetical protein
MKALDLIDWTMQEAKQLSPTPHAPGALDGTPSLHKLLEVLESERAKPKADEKMKVVDAPSTWTIPEEPTAPRYSEAIAAVSHTIDEPSLPFAIPAAPSTAEKARKIEDSMSAILKAIVAPNIYTGRTDRARAIDLRWMLKDIKTKRLKWWPVSQLDMQILIGFELVEMRDGEPQLTNAGLDVII